MYVGEEIWAEQRTEMESQDKLITRNDSHRETSSPRSLSFFRNRDSVWLVLAFQSNQQPVNHLLDMRHVLVKDRR